MPQIKEVLQDSNPWWKEKYTLEFKDREIYKQIKKFLPLPQMIAFTGLRRVGKTTLMFKIIQDYIKNGFDPRNIIYFSFDEFRATEIREVVSEYEKLLEKDFRKGNYLLLLDEIQKMANWEDQLKRIYDTFGKNVKIIVSGSESLLIRRTSKETLAGRLLEFKIDTLSFKEFLIFRGVTFEPLSLYEKELCKLFGEFMLTLGFPELVNINDKAIIKKYVKESIVEKIFYIDIPRIFKISDPSALEPLLNILMEEPGQLLEISEIAKELKISRQTLSNYLAYLEESFLIRKLYNYSKNRRKVERKLRKYYPTLISVDLLFKEDDLSKSKVFEWFIVNQLKAEFFWRDPYQKEVDIILIENDRALPIEVKYGKVDFVGLSTFMRRYQVSQGLVISMWEEREQKIGDKTVSITPAFKYLLIRRDEAVAKQ